METDEGLDEDHLIKSLTQKVKIAERVADSAQGFKVQAFDRVLNFLLEIGLDPVKVDSRKSRKQPKEQSVSGKNKRRLVASDRIRPIMDASPELVSRYASISALSPKGKIYEVLNIAVSEFSLPRLECSEIVMILNDKFRQNVNYNTIKSGLFRAPIGEIGRSKGSNGEVEYSLMAGGVEYLQALKQKQKPKANDILNAFSKEKDEEDK